MEGGEKKSNGDEIRTLQEDMANPAEKSNDPPGENWRGKLHSGRVPGIPTEMTSQFQVLPQNQSFPAIQQRMEDYQSSFPLSDPPFNCEPCEPCEPGDTMDVPPHASGVQRANPKGGEEGETVVSAPAMIDAAIGSGDRMDDGNKAPGIPSDNNTSNGDNISSSSNINNINNINNNSNISSNYNNNITSNNSNYTISNDLSRDEISRDEISRDEISRDEISRDDISRDEIPREEISRDEISRDEISREEISREDDVSMAVETSGDGERETNQEPSKQEMEDEKQEVDGEKQETIGKPEIADEKTNDGKPEGEMPEGEQGNEMEGLESAEPPTEVLPVKRKRGRPRKNPRPGDPPPPPPAPVVDRPPPSGPLQTTTAVPREVSLSERGPDSRRVTVPEMLTYDAAQRSKKKKKRGPKSAKGPKKRAGKGKGKGLKTQNANPEPLDPVTEAMELLRKGKLRQKDVPEIVIHEPKAGDDLTRGDVHTLRWSSLWPCPPSDLHIVLVRSLKKTDWVYPIVDAGEIPAPPKRLALNTEWEIQFSIPIDTPPADDFYIEVVSARTKATGRTEGRFTVSADGVHDESDVGVWCVCGDVSTSTRAALGNYVQCDTCGAWLHSGCKGSGFDPMRGAGDDDYQCPWCITTPLPPHVLAQTMIGNLMKLSHYFRKGNADLWSSMCVTPSSVANYMTRLILPSDRRCMDLGAGTGALSACLPPGSLCAEIRRERATVGAHAMPWFDWRVADVTETSFVQAVAGNFDLVISNPDFEVAMPTLYVALLALDQSNPDARCIFLLPSNYFESSPSRGRMFKVLDVHIETEYKLGCLAYLLQRPDADKKTPDSLFVMRPGRRDKYSHMSINVRLAGMM